MFKKNFLKMEMVRGIICPKCGYMHSIDSGFINFIDKQIEIECNRNEEQLVVIKFGKECVYYDYEDIQEGKECIATQGTDLYYYFNVKDVSGKELNKEGALGLIFDPIKSYKKAKKMDKEENSDMESIFEFILKPINFLISERQVQINCLKYDMILYKQSETIPFKEIVIEEMKRRIEMLEKEIKFFEKQK